MKTSLRTSISASSNHLGMIGWPIDEGSNVAKVNKTMRKSAHVANELMVGIERRWSPLHHVDLSPP